MPEIPKVIHYCWFGGGAKNALIENCIASWKKQLPDYTITEWNEQNTVIDCAFAEGAARHKKWAFLSDYIRLQILYAHGGIYMDTDMYVIKPFDALLSHNCFLGKQNEEHINASIIGCVKHNTFIAACIAYYQSIVFNEFKLMELSIPAIVSQVYNRFPQQEEVKIYAAEYFYPYPFERSVEQQDFTHFIYPQTYAVHLWNASWFSKREWASLALQDKEYLKFLKLTIHHIREQPSYIFQIGRLIIKKLLSNHAR